MSISESGNADVRIEIEAVATGVDDLERKLASLNERLGYSNKFLDDAEKRTVALSNAMKQAAGASAAVGKATGNGGTARKGADPASSIAKSKESINAAREAVEIDELTRAYGGLYVAERKAADSAEEVRRAHEALRATESTGTVKQQAQAWEQVAKAEGTAATATIGLNKELDRQQAVMNSAASAYPRVRYALYDVATTAGITAAALFAATGAAAGLSASYESAFTGVERTARVGGDGAQYLRNQLEGLTREIPETFQATAQIATLGAQLDIAATDLASFTENVAQFTATAGTDVETTAQGFGRIGQLLGVASDEYRNLGSAILYAGNTSVATEADVLAYSQRLAIAGNEAGFTASQTIALAATLASLGVGLEASQGATQRVFQDINRAVESNSDKLISLGAISGMSAEQYAAAWNGDPQAAFSALIAGLAQVENRTQALDALGFVDTREVRTLTALADNLGFYNEQLQTTGQAYLDGTYLAESYGKVVDDLSSRWQIFISSVQSFGAAAGDAVAPALKEILDLLSGMLHGLTDMLRTPAGEFLAGTALSAMAVVGALALLVTGVSLSVAALFALRTAVAGLGWNTATTGIQGLIASLIGVNGAAGAASVGVNIFKMALIGTGIGAVVVLLGSLAAAFMMAGQSAEAAFNTYIGNTAGLAEAIASDTAAYQEALWSGNAELAGSFQQLSIASEDNTTMLGENAQAVMNTAAVLGITPAAFDGATGAIIGNTVALGDNTLAWVKNQLMQSEAFKNLAGNAEFTSYWTAVGADMNEVIRRSASGGQQAVLDYFAALEAAAVVGGAKFQSAFSSFSQMQYGMQTLDSGGFLGMGGSAAGKGISELSKLFDGLNGQMVLAGQTGGAAGGAIAAGADSGTAAMERLGDSIGGGGGGGGGGVIEKLRTLEDYANDLSGVFDRAFELRFGGQQGLDAIASGWIKLKEEAEAAAEKVRDYRTELESLTSDKSLQEFWLANAEGYGDTMRAEKLRADLGETNSKIAKTTKALAKEQAALDKSTDGNSKSAIDNRAALYNLAGQYEALLTHYAKSGMSQADLQAKAAELKAEFMQQAAQLGYTGAAVVQVGQHFDGLITIIERIPRDIEIDVNADPALQALAEFERRAQEAAANASRAVSTGGGLGWNAPQIPPAIIPVAYRMPSYDQLMAMQALIRQQTGDPNFRIALGPGGQGGQTFGYAGGGYTGPGGKYEVAGPVHRDEYVFDQGPTNRWSVGTLDALRSADSSTIAMVKALLGVGGMAFQQSAPPVQRIVSAGTAGRTGPSYVELSPIDRALLREIADRSGIDLGGNTLQQFAGASNVSSGRRGRG